MNGGYRLGGLNGPQFGGVFATVGRERKLGLDTSYRSVVNRYAMGANFASSSGHGCLTISSPPEAVGG
jgi:hypothetical protein